ncbi:MAG TPA: hypothetical protein VH540_15395 [Ktedonobacterales bacterium]
MRIACIGSRELPPEAALACREMGLALARAGYTVVTGATPGVPSQDEWADWADGAFATGAAHGSPDRLIACLPWQHFPRGNNHALPGIRAEYPDEHPEWAEAAHAFWEKERAPEAGPWQMVRRASRLRLLRTAGILLQSRLLLVWPGEDDEESRFALAFAAWRHLPVIDLSLVSWRDVLAGLLAACSTGFPLKAGAQ